MTGDDRALGVGIIVFIAAIVMAALFFTLADPAVSGVIDTNSERVDNPQAQQHIDRLELIWTNILFYGLFLGGIYVIARGVFESRRGAGP